MFLSPGFRFHPTDVELVMYYLKRKVLGKKFGFEAISELNIYKFSPWDLPDKSCLRTKDLEWYFFCPRERKYASGARTNRATETGYWKTTGKDRAISYNDNNVGMVKTLVFHEGHAPRGKRTDWVIHEYRIQDKQLADAGVSQDAYVLCKVFHKNGPGPKHGAQYGAPFKEEEWENDVEDCCETPRSFGTAAGATTALALSKRPSCSIVTSKVSSETISVHSLPEPGPSSGIAPTNSDMLDDDILHLLASIEDVTPRQNDTNTTLDNDCHQRNIATVPCSDGSDLYNDLGDLGNWSELWDSGIGSSATQEAGYALKTVYYPNAFLELNDLEVPLDSSAVVNGSGHMPTSTNLDAAYNFYSNVEGLYHGANPFDTNQCSSGSGQLPLLPERSSVECISEMLQADGGGTNINQLNNASYSLDFTEPDLSRGINHGGDGTSADDAYNAAYSLCFTAPDESGGIEQNHKRGEKRRIILSRQEQLLDLIFVCPASAVQQLAPQNSTPDSLDVKAEVTCWVSACPDDALAFMLEKSTTFMVSCWWNPPCSEFPVLFAVVFCIGCRPLSTCVLMFVASPKFGGIVMVVIYRCIFSKKEVSYKILSFLLTGFRFCVYE